MEIGFRAYWILRRAKKDAIIPKKRGRKLVDRLYHSGYLKKIGPAVKGKFYGEFGYILWGEGEKALLEYEAAIKNSCRFIITTIIALVGLVVAILGLWK